MRLVILSAVLAMLLFAGAAQITNRLFDDIVHDHILPRFDALATSSAQLAMAAQGDCAPTSDTLRTAYGDAFDARVSASHLRFGPTEVDDRAFALSFWPDPRGSTPRSLANLATQPGF